MRPNVSVRICNNRLSNRDVLVETNELGLRAPGLRAKGSGKTTVLMLGDSITQGEYLESELTLCGQLQRYLGDDYFVVNAGVNGLGIEDEINLLREVGGRIRPDVVVLNFYLNDAVRSPVIEVLSPPSFLQSSYLARHAANGLSLLLARPDAQTIPYARIASWKNEVVGLPAKIDAQPGTREHFYSDVQEAFEDWGNAWSSGVWEYFGEKLSELRQVTDNQGANLLVVGFPLRAQIEAPFLEDFPQRKLAEKAAELGLPYADLLQPLRMHFTQSQSALFFDHCHPNEQGFEVIGKYLASEILSRFPSASNSTPGSWPRR